MRSCTLMKLRQNVYKIYKKTNEKKKKRKEMITCFNTINQVILESFCSIDGLQRKSRACGIIIGKNINKELKKKKDK